jgi:spore maturation protein CgeB
VFYEDDLSDLVDKIIYYLNHDQERIAIGQAGAEHTRKYHLDICRARYFLEECKLL